MSSLKKSIEQSRALSKSTFMNVSMNKDVGGSLFDMGSGGVSSQLNRFRDQGANKQRYGLFRGWVHAAINALAMKAAGQPVNLGQIEVSEVKKGKNRPGAIKSKSQFKMTKSAETKAANAEMTIVAEHPLMDAFQNPNNIQSKWQFVYSFVANLNLTGWSFIVRDADSDGNPLFYSLPTTWVRPDHSKGAFAQFRIVNPNDPTAEVDSEPLDGSMVRFAYIPNPANPLAALAPAQAQIDAIKIDEHIQGSQEIFFENGIFPSVIITMGTNPHPDVPAGIRPRLTAAQRRQVTGAIKKISSGIANYGNPAIIDGFIEKIERLSATQNEMGWDKSEKAVRTRILSAFSVHPFILGEEMAGSYAQAYVVQDLFCERVNTFLDMLGVLLTGFANDPVEKQSADGQEIKDTEKFLVWFEACVAVDPSMNLKMWENARLRGDVSEREFRSYMGLPPDDDGNEAFNSKAQIAALTSVPFQVASGKISQDQGQAVLISVGIPDDLAVRIAGESIKQSEIIQEQTEALKLASESLKQTTLAFNSPADKLSESIISNLKLPLLENVK